MLFYRRSTGRQRDRFLHFFYILFSSWFLLRFYSYALCSQFILFLFFAIYFCSVFRMYAFCSRCCRRVCFSCFSSFYFSIMFIRNTRRIHFLAADCCLAHLYARCYAISLFTCSLLGSRLLDTFYYFRGAKLYEHVYECVGIVWQDATREITGITHRHLVCTHGLRSRSRLCAGIFVMCVDTGWLFDT